MVDFIVLTKAQGDAVRGPTTPGNALDPIELKDGSFVLPLAVLSDAAHLLRRTALVARLKREIVTVEWKVAEGPLDAPREADAVETGRI